MSNDAHNPVVLVQPEWVDLRRLREYATVSNRTLRAWIHSPVDPLPAVRVGTKILVRRSEFDAWMECHRIKQVDLGGMVEEVMEAVAGGR
jgi:excisionase family DNA binding protein